MSESYPISPYQSSDCETDEEMEKKKKALVRPHEGHYFCAWTCACVSHGLRFLLGPVSRTSTPRSGARPTPKWTRIPSSHFVPRATSKVELRFFPVYAPSPDFLAEIFGEHPSRRGRPYHKRTSSANWSRDGVTQREAEWYRLVNGFKQPAK